MEAVEGHKGREFSVHLAGDAPGSLHDRILHLEAWLSVARAFVRPTPCIKHRVALQVVQLMTALLHCHKLGTQDIPEFKATSQQ